MAMIKITGTIKTGIEQCNFLSHNISPSNYHKINIIVLIIVLVVTFAMLLIKYS